MRRNPGQRRATRGKRLRTLAFSGGDATNALQVAGETSRAGADEGGGGGKGRGKQEEEEEEAELRGSAGGGIQ